jgi:hypothetical protein
MKPLHLNKIISHPGPGHRDDFLAVSILLAAAENFPTVLRKEPSKAECIDTKVAVVDIGKNHNPDILMFDHHQFPSDAPPTCAMNLVVDYLGLTDAFKLCYPWYEITGIIDSKGPMYAATHLGINPKNNLFQMLSPMEEWLLAGWSQHRVLNHSIEGQNLNEREAHTLYGLMHRFGESLIDRAEEFEHRWEDLKHTETHLIPETNLHWLDVSNFDRNDDPAMAVNQYIRTECPEAIVSVSQDDRGEGMTLYRLNDHPQIDFSRLKNEESVLFAHNNGFVAKTKQMMSTAEVSNLISKGVKRL